ncbi:MAG: acyltransferase [Candidatus Magasanikbacteria bacterium]|nr:acyltransferase [Candidatus Magasanikbacteria bacterium]
MIVSITNATQSTIFFVLFLISALIFTAKKKDTTELFSASVTRELKGFALLSIIFSHVGYFLVSDDRFLFPLSILSGVGVNMFLFLSGFGLTMASIKKNFSRLQFYRVRLPKLYVPFWLVLGIFLLLDFFILHITYSPRFVLQFFTGLFTHADIFTDFNSALWYITLIIFYYLVFPLFFIKKYPWVSAILIFLLSYLLVKETAYELMPTIHLYKIHIIAFPLGVFVGSLYGNYKLGITTFFHKISNSIWKIFFISFCILSAVYFAYYSGIGESLRKEQIVSLITMMFIMGIFMIKKYEFKILSYFGLYSYEIYLLHWPILWRYTNFFQILPSWFALILYLGFFVLLAIGVQRITRLLLRV